MKLKLRQCSDSLRRVKRCFGGNPLCSQGDEQLTPEERKSRKDALAMPSRLLTLTMDVPIHLIFVNMANT